MARRGGGGNSREYTCENPYGPSPTAIKAMSEAIEKGAYYANASVAKLKSMIAERNGVSTDHIMITSGSSGALTYLAAAVSQHGHIIGPDLFWDTTSKMGTRNSPFGLKYLPKTEDLSIDLNKMYQSINSETALVQVTNPNNPTGMLLDADKLSDFSKKASKKTMVLIDEAYNELTDDPVKNSMLPLIKQGENIVVARTFSKIYGLSSLRIGWGYGSKKIIDALNVIKPPFNVNEVAQKAAIESLKDKKFISRSVKHNYFYATKLKDFLSNYDISSNKVSANFLLLNFNKCKLKAKSFYEKLKKKGIILRSTEEGYKIKNMLRLTIGSKDENIKFIKATQNIFKK